MILRDSCVIASNASLGADGSDDDRFGLLVGDTYYESGTVTIQSCIVEGVVGSAAALARGNETPTEGTMADYPPAYEYAAGILGEVGKSNSTIVVTIKDCTAFVRNYTGESKIIVNKERVTPNLENNAAFGTSDIAAGYDAIDAAVAAARQ